MPAILQSNHALLFDGVTDSVIVPQGSHRGVGNDDASGNRSAGDILGDSASGDNARLRDWWLDHEVGIVYFNNSYPFFEWNAIKVAYIYGERYLEKAI